MQATPDPLTTSLPQVLEAIARDMPRGGGRFPVRIERSDGLIIEGDWDDRKENGLSLLVDGTQSLEVVPFDAVHRLWVPAVIGRRHHVYLGICGLTGVLVAIVSTLLTHSPWLPGILLGVAAALTLLLAGWFPPVHGWIVVWQLRFQAGEP